MPAKGTGKAQKIDIEQLAAFCRLKPTLEDTAAFFKCNPRSIERIIKNNTGLTFIEFRSQNMVHTRHGLIRKAIQKAMAGDNTMLIWTMKNLCGWTDKVEQSTTHKIEDSTVRDKLANVLDAESE